MKTNLQQLREEEHLKDTDQVIIDITCEAIWQDFVRKHMEKIGTVPKNLKCLCGQCDLVRFSLEEIKNILKGEGVGK